MNACKICKRIKPTVYIEIFVEELGMDIGDFYCNQCLDNSIISKILSLPFKFFHKCAEIFFAHT